MMDLDATLTDEEARLMEKIIAERTAHIIGYRNLSETEVALVNEVKLKAEEVSQLLSRLGKLGGLDPRWLAAGTLDLQKGFMSVVRSITRPTSF